MLLQLRFVFSLLFVDSIMNSLKGFVYLLDLSLLILLMLTKRSENSVNVAAPNRNIHFHLISLLIDSLLNLGSKKYIIAQTIFLIFLVNQCLDISLFLNYLRYLLKSTNRNLRSNHNFLKHSLLYRHVLFIKLFLGRKPLHKLLYSIFRLLYLSSFHKS